MFNVIKSAIEAGGYKLSEMQQKIRKFYMMGNLTEAELDELLRLASGGVSADAERPENILLIQTLAEELEALKARVTALEGGEDPAEPDKPDEPTYPEWKPWDGISKDYQRGDIVSHNGKLWESVFEGQNVWEPGTVGTESLWVEFKA
jgi:hypothetical protein